MIKLDATPRRSQPKHGRTPRQSPRKRPPKASVSMGLELLLPGSAASGRTREHSVIVEAALGAGPLLGWHAAVDTTAELEMAVKVEHADSEAPDLQSLHDLFQMLDGTGVVPEVEFIGPTVNTSFVALLVHPFGPSISDIASFCGGKLSLAAVLLLGQRVLSALSKLHAEGFVHGDISSSTVFVGPPSDTEHIMFCDVYGRVSKDSGRADCDDFCGLRRLEYKQRAAHKVYVPSMSGDVERLGHMLLEMLLVKLPWHGLEDPAQVAELRRTCDPAAFCTAVPEALLELLLTARSTSHWTASTYKQLVSSLAEAARCLDGPPCRSLLEYTMQHNQTVQLADACFPGSVVSPSKLLSPSPGALRSQLLRIYLPDGGFKTTKVEPFTCTQEVLSFMCDKLDVLPSMTHLFALSLTGEGQAHLLRPEQPLLEAISTMQQHQEGLSTVRFSQYLMVPPKSFKHLSVPHLALLFAQLSSNAARGSFVVGSISHGIKLAALNLYHDHGSRAPTEMAASMAAAYQIELPALLTEYEFLCKSRPKHKDAMLWYVQCSYSWIPAVGAYWSPCSTVRVCPGMPKGPVHLGVSFNGIRVLGLKAGRELALTQPLEEVSGARVTRDADGTAILSYSVGAGTVAVRTPCAFDFVQLIQDYQSTLRVPAQPHLPEPVGACPHALQWQSPAERPIPAGFSIHGALLADSDPLSAQFLTSQVAAARDAASKGAELATKDSTDLKRQLQEHDGTAAEAVCSLRTLLHCTGALVCQWARQWLRLSWEAWLGALRAAQMTHPPKHTTTSSGEPVELWRRGTAAVLLLWRRQLLWSSWLCWTHRVAVLRRLETANDCAIGALEAEAQAEVEALEAERAAHEKEQKAKMRVLMSKIKELKSRA